MGVLKELNTFLDDFDNIFGVLGIAIAIVGIIVGGIGIKLISKFKIVNSNIEKSQVANNIVNNGASYQDIDYVANKVTNDKILRITKITDIEKLIEQDNRYCIALSWAGTQLEFDELVQEGRIIKNAQYIIL